jgi:hypothetical protein
MFFRSVPPSATAGNPTKGARHIAAIERMDIRSSPARFMKSAFINKPLTTNIELEDAEMMMAFLLLTSTGGKMEEPLDFCITFLDSQNRRKWFD